MAPVPPPSTSGASGAGGGAITPRSAAPSRGAGTVGSPVGSDDSDEDGGDGGKGELCKRKDFLGIDEEARLHPSRTYYYRKVRAGLQLGGGG
jgi:hypothetical protein